MMHRDKDRGCIASCRTVVETKVRLSQFSKCCYLKAMTAITHHPFQMRLSLREMSDQKYHCHFCHLTNFGKLAFEKLHAAVD